MTTEQCMRRKMEKKGENMNERVVRVSSTLKKTQYMYDIMMDGEGSPLSGNKRAM